ncbi:MAG: exonuclease domain-containing protein [Clostridiales bacterium]|nr:exonuclease domain-containing protein [Clostridiales bacterium]
MAYIIMDLEWNGGFSERTQGYFNEIMEIGAVKLDNRRQVTGEFHVVIRPLLVRRLSKLVREMTGITEEELETGVSFSEAIASMQEFVGLEPAVLLTWSTTDLFMLEENLCYFQGGREIPFMTHYADLQAYCQQRLGTGAAQQLGLEAACRIAEIDEEGVDHHRALDDSRLTARLFARLFDQESFLPYIRPADREFYDRLNFKVSYIGDIDSPLIDRTAFRFLCDSCEAELKPEKDWKPRGRGFFAPLLCSVCGNRYHARVQFKRTYDGVTVKRRLTPHSDPEEGESRGNGGEKSNGEEQGEQAPGGV